MNVAILTTDTTHHAYYVWKVSQQFPVGTVLLESWRPQAPFETAHAFEQQRDEYERDVLLAGGPRSCADIPGVHHCRRVNDPAAIALLSEATPDVILTFGIGRMTADVFRAARLACLNLHGGNPEEYRGLDSHLWAIYHRDFDNLLTTLHWVDEDFDTGAIALQCRLDIPDGTELYQLRSINTEACVQLSLRALQTLCGQASLPARQQTRRGRYYSHMPACLKQECVTRFHQYTSHH